MRATARTLNLNFYNEVPSGTINGSNVTFTLANTPYAGSVSVYLDGLIQRITTDYTISGSTITFVTAPGTGQDVYCTYMGKT